MKKNLIYIVVVVYLILSNAISNYSDLPLMFPVAFLFIALFGYFLVTDYLLSENDVEKLSDNIIGKMRKEGYQCEKDEGVNTVFLLQIK